MSDLEKLLHEFARDFESGADPDPGKFLARADPGERPALADRLDAYLDRAPTQAWDPGAYERSPAKAAADRVFESLQGEAGSWPELLPKLRARARIKREELTQRLADALGYGAEQPRVHAYYHQMEHGQIPAAGVSDSVLDALGSILGTSRETLRAAGERVGGAELTAGAGFARQALPDARYDATPIADAHVGGRMASPAERDDLDELFLGAG